jgi:hypothetical protein
MGWRKMCGCLEEGYDVWQLCQLRLPVTDEATTPSRQGPDGLRLKICGLRPGFNAAAWTGQSVWEAGMIVCRDNKAGQSC